MWRAYFCFLTDVIILTILTLFLYSTAASNNQKTFYLGKAKGTEWDTFFLPISTCLFTAEYQYIPITNKTRSYSNGPTSVCTCMYIVIE